MKNILTLKHVCKVFGDRPSVALQLLDQGENKGAIFEKTGQTLSVANASFDIREGEIFVIMGLSGSGKSTLARLLNRLIKPSRGEILLNGEDMAKANDQRLQEIRRKTMSMVFQSFALMPHLSVLDNTAFGLELSGVDLISRRKRALTLLQQVGLDAWANSYPDELSGGMQQRVGLVRALVNDPQILLMDEAFSALDPLIRIQMQDKLLELQSQRKRTIIFISHDLDEAMRIGDRIAIMEDGHIAQIGAPKEIIKAPANDYVHAFFQSVDISTVLKAGDIASHQQAIAIEYESSNLDTAIRQLQQFERKCGYVVNKDLEFLGEVTIDSLKQARKINGSLSNAMTQDIQATPADKPLNKLMGKVAEALCGVPVVDNKGHYQGIVTRAALLRALNYENKEDHVRQPME